MWTSSLPLSVRRRTRLGLVRVCVCSLFLARLARPASGARCGAPHLSRGRSLCSLGPLRAWVALTFLLVFLSFFFCAPAVSGFVCFGPWVHWTLALLGCPPPFFSFCALCVVGPHPWRLSYCLLCFLAPLLNPQSKDGRCGRMDASLTGSTHAKTPQRTQPKIDNGGNRQG